MLLISEASRAFSGGTRIPLKFAFLAAIARGNIPRTGLISPLSPSSPRIRVFFRKGWFGSITPVAANRARAMGRSNALPSFLRSAGARFRVTVSMGHGNCDCMSAERILTLASRTAASGSPTVWKFVKPSLM